MKGSTGGKWILSALSVVILAFAVGCAKKEMVKSTDTASGAAVSELPPVETQVGQQEPIVTETMKPDEAQTAMAGVAATQEKPSEFPDIHFDYDKSFLREDAKLILQDVAAYLKENRAASILIEGHCDERGTPEYNIALGERRAESAKSYLVSLGVTAGAVSTVSFGEEKPIDPGHDEMAWERNRRAHFVKR
ncbi:MAG: peptidoglycan-associated lipoprotein Pal [Candidatus Deferrimicrobiaceae bacterium]